MKLAFLILTAAAGAAGICDLCGASSAAQAATQGATHAAALSASAAPATALDTVVLHIEGMTCGGCTLATRTVLKRLDGVTEADVSYERKRAAVTYDPARVTIARMIAAVAALKYTATVVTPAARSARASAAPAATAKHP